MMGRALLMVGALATLGMVGAGGVGYFVSGSAHFRLHVLLGLVSCVLLLFSHSWILFYLIGTGKAIKEAAAGAALGGEFAERTRELKGRSYPALMLAMTLAMATFILGGGAFSSLVPLWIHHVLFWLAVAAQLRALWIENLVLLDNQQLMREVDRELRSERR